MKLTRLEIQNFMGITAFESSFDGAPVIALEAKNGTGKTSILRAVQALFAGGKAIPDVPIKRGAKKAQIIGETETLICKRTFTPKGTKLEVRPNEKGAIKMTKPQQVLDELIGMFLDPLEFDRMAEDKRLQVLRDLVGLDFKSMDDQRKAYETERRDAGRDLKAAQARLDAIPKASDDGDTETVAQLFAEIQRREDVNDDHNSQRARLAEMRARGDELAGDEEREGIIAELKALEVRLQEEIMVAAMNVKDAVTELEQLRTDGRKLAAEVDALVDLDVEEIRAKLSQAEERATAAAKQEERKRLAAEVEKLDLTYENLTEKMAQLDETKAGALASANYPIAGLEACDDGVYLDGVPWSQANASRRIIASTSIGFAVHPKLKIVCIENASLLDPEKRRLLHETAASAGGQAFIEIVGSGVKVVIEEGGVQS
jgi:predicted ATP-dependent endonuclease of OLD family